MERDPGKGGSHRMLADTEMDVSSRISPGAAGSALCRQPIRAFNECRAFKVALALQHGARRRIQIG